MHSQLAQQEQQKWIATQEFNIAKSNNNKKIGKATTTANTIANEMASWMVRMAATAAEQGAPRDSGAHKIHLACF